MGSAQLVLSERRYGLSASLLEVSRFRELLWSLVVNELRLRYRRSVLGFLWTMLNPLLMMTVLSIVFSTVMKFQIKDYAVLLIAGLLPWIFFAQAVNTALMSVVGRGALLRRVYIPKLIIPLSSVLANLVNFLLSLVPLLALLLVFEHPILHPSMLMLFPAVVVVALFASGVSFLFATLNVFYRDFGHMTEVILQIWFYLSPVIYTKELIPEEYHAIFAWNPLYYIIDCFRAPIYHSVLPSVETFLFAAGSALIALILGVAVFVSNEDSFVLEV